MKAYGQDGWPSHTLLPLESQESIYHSHHIAIPPLCDGSPWFFIVKGTFHHHQKGYVMDAVNRVTACIVLKSICNTFRMPSQFQWQVFSSFYIYAIFLHQSYGYISLGWFKKKEFSLFQFWPSLLWTIWKNIHTHKKSAQNLEK